MLKYPFQNYEEFKELFGIIEHGNGVKSRRNKVLLQWYKQPWVLKDSDVRARKIKSMTQLFEYVVVRNYNEAVRAVGNNGLHECWCANVPLLAIKYKLDEYKGLCEDGDPRAIRYINTESNRVFKMKAGKFIKNVMEENAWGREVLCEAVKRWVEEEFTQKWMAYSEGLLPKYMLVVDEDFRTIYGQNSDIRCGEGFNSCMSHSGDTHYLFYENAVKAHAASLRTLDNKKVLARCVIFDEVQDEQTGEVLRLAERQYAVDMNDVLKRVLVDKLVDGGYIDGYKKVGADCCNSRSFVGKNGEDWSGRKFSIECNLDDGDDMAYQDSFKWYIYGENRSYNWSGVDYTDELDSTDDYYGRNGDNYDEYHDEYTNDDLATVYYNGHEMTCSEERLGDFTWSDYEDMYVHDDDGVDTYDEGWCIERNCEYSSVLDRWYRDSDLKEEDEEEYKQENWTYAEYDDEYFEDSDDVITWHYSNGEETTVARWRLDTGEFMNYEEREGEYYEVTEE